MELPTYTKQWHNDVYPDIDASRPELSVKGKRVVVTGGGGGIGSATAKAFIAAGAAEVVILGRTKQTLEATKSAIMSKHPNANVVSVVVDISQAGSVTEAFASIAGRGLIDIFVNNAAYLSIGTVGTSDPTEWFKVYETNIKGSLLVTQAVLKNINPKDGIIINVTSAAGHVPYVPGYSAYASSKLASAKAFEYLQHENPDLKVFNIQPGVIESTSLATKAYEQSGITFPQQDTVELPANFMVWLCSPEAAFLKGRFVWANWDVKELQQKKQLFENDPTLLTVGLLGWPQ
ncbi:putative oxidoreductase [Cladophialophora carrionii]|uniref:Putative oxidoreductase n=1 Tax=Cladophialophora carrionii TaxID=86049 RepID=A0A1C1CS56_9EURO|nr:putative oxidoreductase [Cladophialophora carrionii]